MLTPNPIYSTPVQSSAPLGSFGEYSPNSVLSQSLSTSSASIQPSISQGSMPLGSSFQPSFSQMSNPPQALGEYSPNSVLSQSLSAPMSASIQPSMGQGSAPITIAPVPNLFLGDRAPTPTKQMIKDFWSNAKGSPMTTNCYLDGRYFNHVLSPYEGTVQEPMYIGIEEGAFTSDPNDGDKREFEARVAFNTNALKMTSGKVRFIRVIIEIGRADQKQGVSRHSNLITICKERKMVKRFEPMANHPYRGPINSILEEYFGNILPDYKYSVCGDHPQSMTSPICPSRGMCAAYVLMKVMKILTGKGCGFPKDPIEAEKQVLKFAFAIEKIYGTLPGQPELDYGFFDNWSGSKWNPSNWSTGQKALGGAAVGAAAGGLLAKSWSGALIGAGIGGAAGWLLGRSSDKKKQQRYYY